MKEFYPQETKTPYSPYEQSTTSTVLSLLIFFTWQIEIIVIALFK